MGNYIGKFAVPSTAQMRLYLTLAMGVFIPLFSLALSHCGGNLLQGETTTAMALGALAFAIQACVLSVSLDHLRWAIGNITRSPQWASWLLAIAFDAALVFGELVHVAAHECGLSIVVYAIMIAVTVFSMTLNCWAFLKHPTEELRTANTKAKKSRKENQS